MTASSGRRRARAAGPGMPTIGPAPDGSVVTGGP
jgi:hypothetical protein